MHMVFSDLQHYVMLVHSVHRPLTTGANTVWQNKDPVEQSDTTETLKQSRGNEEKPASDWPHRMRQMAA